MRLGLPFWLASLCVPLVLANCDRTDPYARDGLWRPLGANDTNLRAMVANPADLSLGRATAFSPGDTAALAVVRLRADNVRPLPDSSITTVRVNGAGAAAPAAGPSPAAGAAVGGDGS